MAVSDRPTPMAPHYDELQEQIGEIRFKDNKGYHDGAQVEDWLDYTLGAHNWSFRIPEHGRDEESDELWVAGELTATFWLPDGDGRLVAHVVTKQNYGSQQVKRFKARPDGAGGTVLGKAISLGDDRKSAATDCLKRCARLLGVGRYLWRKADQLDLPYRRGDDEEEARNRPAARPQGRQAPTADRGASGATPSPIRPPRAAQEPPRPLEAGERAALENRYESLREHAQQLGARTSWLGQGSEAWTDAQLPKYIGLLEGIVARHEGAA